MNTTMRAKFRVTKVESVGLPEPSYEILSLHAVTDSPFDADGKSDDNSFSRWTPSGDLTMSVTNPSLFGKIKEGEKYYLDFTKAGN